MFIQTQCPGGDDRLHSFGNHDADISSPKNSQLSFKHSGHRSGDRSGGGRSGGGDDSSPSQQRDRSRITTQLNKHEKRRWKEDEINKSKLNNWAYFDHDEESSSSNQHQNHSRKSSHRNNRADDTHKERTKREHHRSGRDGRDGGRDGKGDGDVKLMTHKFEFMNDTNKDRNSKNELKIAKFILGFRRYLFRRAAQEQKKLPASRRLMAHPTALCEKV